jgi:hypothetical protein
VHLDPPGIDPTNGQFEGSIDGQVNVWPVDAVSTPEPSGLVLAAIGLVSVATWRKRRRVHSYDWPGED